VVSGPVESASQQLGVQRQEDEEEIQTKPLAATITPFVQRQEDEEEIQTKPLPSTALGAGLQRQEEEEEIQTKPLLDYAQGRPPAPGGRGGDPNQAAPPAPGCGRRQL